MIFFLDFEASSLLPGGFPVEIGWVDEHGTGEGHLIRPEAEWSEWDYNAEAVHGLSRDQLMAEGRPAAEVAYRAADVLIGNDVFSDAPGFDGGWLDVLLEAADIPAEPRIRLLADGQAHSAACRPLLDGLPPATSLRYGWERTVRYRQISEIINAARTAEVARGPKTHRALDDAMGLWRIWIGVKLRVEEALR